MKHGSKNYLTFKDITQLIIFFFLAPNKTVSCRIVEKLSTVLSYYKVSCYKAIWFTHMLCFNIKGKKSPPYNALFVAMLPTFSLMAKCVMKVKRNPEN